MLVLAVRGGLSLTGWPVPLCTPRILAEFSNFKLGVLLCVLLEKLLSWPNYKSRLGVGALREDLRSTSFTTHFCGP